MHLCDLTQLISFFGDSSGAFFENKTLKALYRLVWKPIDSLLVGITKVYYAPSGILQLINFSAMQYPAGGKLMDRYDLHLVTCTREIVDISSAETTPVADILLYGGIKYDMDSIALSAATIKYQHLLETRTNLNRGRQVYSFPYLKGTEGEIKSIEMFAKKNNIPYHSLRGYNANEESFNFYATQNPTPTIIHFATHGFFYPDTLANWRNKQRPFFQTSENILLRCGIAMAGANAITTGKESVSGMEDGVLTAAEISNVRLKQTKLVVLSACETGLGKIDNVEGVYGLQRAFKIAGVNNLIMTLWLVDDKAAQAFMIYFYQGLLNEKLSIHDAFKTAQQSMRLNEAFQRPYDWAAFVLLE